MSTKDGYRHAYDEARTVLDEAIALSFKKHGRQSDNRRQHAGNLAFNIIVGHMHALLMLAPVGPLGGNAPHKELWNLTSMATLARSLVDAYYTMFYLAGDQITEEASAFRSLIWDYHNKKECLEMLCLVGSTSNELDKIEYEILSMKKSIETHGEYASQSKEIRKAIIKGKQPFIMTNSQLSEKAGISPKYYRLVFMFLSGFVHAHPFSMSHLSTFRAGDDASLNSMMQILRYGTSYFCFALRDFKKLFPELSSTLNKETDILIDEWIGVVSNYHAQL